MRPARRVRRRGGLNATTSSRTHAHAEPDARSDSNAHPGAYAYPGADADAQPDSDAHSDTYSNPDTHAAAHGDEHLAARPQCERNLRQ